MFNFIKSIFSFRDENSNKHSENANTTPPRDENISISSILEDNKKNLYNVFNNSPDLIVREVKIANNPAFTSMLVYIDNMIDISTIEQSIIGKLTTKNEDASLNRGSKEYSQYLLGVRNEDIYTDINKVIDSILSGKLVQFINGIAEALVVNINNPPSRTIEEPEVETAIRGPREGFTESISTNITLIRKKIKSTNLKIESLKLGRETRTDISIIYLSNIVNKKIVSELKERLSKIDVNAVLGINYIKEYIDDNPLSSFPTMFSTERPDVASGKLLEGRIAILVDGTPVVSTVPAIFVEFMLTNEDYYINFISATINRLIRYISLILSFILPGSYIAVVTFHQELIPTPLLITIIKARSGVPYPALTECILLLLAFEVLREAGVRMPRTVGQAISVVGALILGEAAVEAGLVSTPMLIVVGVTAISSFAVPSTDMLSAITLPRFLFLILGGSFGLLGLTCGILILLMKLISMRSFGVPYMSPLAPVITDELLDVFIRRPHWNKFKRSWLIVGRKSIKKEPVSRINSIKEEHKKAGNEKE